MVRVVGLNANNDNNYIDLAQPKSGEPQPFLGMLLLMKIIQHVRAIANNFVVSV